MGGLFICYLCLKVIASYLLMSHILTNMFFAIKLCFKVFIVYISVKGRSVGLFTMKLTLATLKLPFLTRLKKIINKYVKELAYICYDKRF